MIIAYGRGGTGCFRVPLELGMGLPDEAVWIDLLHPTEEERGEIARFLKIDLPTHEEMREIEVSSRLYFENGSAYMTTPVITKSDTEHPGLGVLTFILTPTHLVTVRYVEPKSVDTFAGRLQRQPELLAGPENALLGLLDAVVGRAADVLELIGSRVDGIGRRVFDDPLPAKSKEAARKPDALREVMRDIGRIGDVTNKVRESLAGLDRLVAYLATVGVGRLNKEQRALLKSLNRDLRSLGEHAGYLGQQTNFLLDATLGVINIEQNAIIKIFSVVAVVFLPPTLIASVYGMNFESMPELDKPWGYPLALILMVISAILPLLYFRRKGWL
ncbi:magnesium transporter [Skermanella stibiiresistens SB22]|uniref:Magnesium transport protein CorA n=1 Tax=Skermanella stibiiresistens SB22 TaxID=1385369 RepID=W9HCT5_9PROT|nr:magnesium transporter CorA family protein [Skermanella stibiiresistens]EWY42546.1 magnesium transporter [Skermanella stibiiresistens SB22]